ncbi:DUF2213 domain-containing protein [Oceaniglobus trochenteri]|uniref:DUF2213 domain-containing protein n=1 Tax=Oceaniglobus trochenteri TaxID=2763260 RepID=UPI001D000313|nr:DUF2213 domain-containing protein [Oceaniglobus trochenteri]
MTEINFTDNAPITGMRQTADGYLVGEVRCARTGCQSYLGSELGLMDRATVTVYRPESAVFHKDSLATFAGKPVTIGHPSEQVTADNWRNHAVGDIGDEIARDGEFVKVPFRLMDAAAITAVQDGAREVSMGYTTPITMQDGVAPDGTPYQAVQSGPIRINHMAIVSKARGGDQLRIGDGAHDGGKDRARWGASPITDRKDVIMADAINTRTVLIDGLSVVTTDAGAQALEKLQGQITDAAKAMTDAEAKHAKEIAAKDAAIAKAEAERDEAKGEVMSDADLDKRVAERADLIGKAKSIVADVKTDGIADAAIRKAVVVAKLGDTMADKSEAYIDARFDILAEDADKADPFADGMKGGLKPAIGANVADEAYAANLTYMQAAYRGALATAKEA